jgi:putative aldouronate transport system substrate-binding protein
MDMKKTLGALAATVFLTLGSWAFAADAPITFSLFSADPNPNWAGMQDEVGKAITAKTGVTLKVEFPVGSADQKIALIAASGQYPDLISPKGQSASLIDAGALLDLTDLIDKYAPHIKAMLGDQMKRLRYNSKDKAIYFVPNNEAFNQTNFDTDAWFKLQLGALKEAGYPKVKTLQDYEKVIASYVKKHPTTADGKPTLGLSLLADDWRIVISTTNPAFWATGAPDDGEFYIDPKTFKAQEHYFRPEEREYFRWLNHMNDIGLLDKESFIQKYDQYKAKIAQGRVVGLIDADWEVNEAINALKSDNRFDQTYGRFGVVTKEGIKPAYNQLTGFNGGWGVAITKSCKDPVRAIKFLDWLASDEAQVLNNWGIEGKHYKVVGGKRVIPDEVLAEKTNDNNAFTKKTGIGNYNISLRYGDGVKDPTGNYYTAKFPETILKGYSDAEKAALKAYGATYWNDLLPPSKEFPVKAWGAGWSIAVPEDSILKQHWDKEQSVVRKRIPELILAKPADFDKLYDAFLVELHNTTGAMADAESALVQDRIALWTK